MRKQITHISVLQTSKIATLLYLVFSLLYVPIGFGMLIFGGTELKIMGCIYMAMPLIMGIFGFVGAVIACAVYNLCARWVGGVEFTVTDIVPSPPPVTAPGIATT
ncbi:MAG: hypothetical protein O3A51_06725 [Verrucomicrobia bacterium]|nr:hypothetical protein [Verrucomicrobiota bacterium]